MRSKASVKGHPIHPALIPFPIAFLIGAFVADLVGYMTGAPSIWTTGGYLALAGIATALIAAVPGFIDYFFTVPPNSSGKRRATIHMVVNLTSVTLFAVAFLLRGAVDAQPAPAQLALELGAVAFLTVGGWLGGTLAFRNQIGVDHRYAGAGKWSTLSTPASDEPVAVASEGELGVNQMKFLKVGGKRIVLARTEDGYTAFDDHCTHRGGSLAAGTLICGTVQCPWHGSQFDVYSGAVQAGPARKSISVYAVERHHGRLWLKPDKFADSPGISLAASARHQQATADKEIEMKLQEIMTGNPVSITPNDTVQRAAELLSENDCGCLPVIDREGRNRVVGVITDRDIAVRGVALGKPVDTRVREIMSTDIATCSINDDVRDVERVMSDRQVRRVVVVDAAGSCVGIVAQADLALAAGRGAGIQEREVARVVERISEPAQEEQRAR